MSNLMLDKLETVYMLARFNSGNKYPKYRLELTTLGLKLFACP